MNVRIEKSTAKGKIVAPPSKSATHRAILCAALCRGTTRIENVCLSKDVRATIACAESLGATICAESTCCYSDGLESTENTQSAEEKIGAFLKKSPLYTLVVTGTGGSLKKGGVFPCYESGSTLRFFLPLALLASRGEKARFVGSKRLLSRGVEIYEEVLAPDATISKSEEEICISGTLHAGKYLLRGDISSQFVSGLFFALPLLSEDSVVQLLPPVESAPYIDYTIGILRAFGVSIEKCSENTYKIEGNQAYEAPKESESAPARFFAEGDWSNAAILLSLNAFGGEVEVSGLDQNSVQGDKIVLSLLPMFEREFVRTDLSDSPDLAPVLFALAAANRGGYFTGTKRLRYKECDRAEAMQSELSAFGATVNIFENGVEVLPPKHGLSAPAHPLFAHGDHRIVMALSLLCSKVGGTIQGAEAVEKSYPDFFADLSALGVSLSLSC